MLFRSLVQDWLRDQKKYGGWDVARLKSWLLLEDEQAGLADDDDFNPPDFVEIPTFANRLNIAAGRGVQQRLAPVAIPPTVPVNPKTGTSEKRRCGRECFCTLNLR